MKAATGDGRWECGLRHDRWAPLSVLCGFLIGPPAFAQTSPKSLPQSGKVIQGAATFGKPSSSSLTVQQSSNRAVIDWSSFSIGSSQTVNFILPSATSATLNRVTGSTTSVIAGALHSNGELYLINPNGIEITRTGVIDTQSFTASALAIKDGDFLSGRGLYTGNGRASAVTNLGLITVGTGGTALLLGGTVTNAGTIVAPSGKVGLGAGESVTVDLEGDQFLTVNVPSANVPLLKSLITESGRIQVDGGGAPQRAMSSADVARAAIRVDHEVVAGSVTASRDGFDFGGVSSGNARGGSVSIDAGRGGGVDVTGQISATSAAGPGGSISITGENLRLVGATLDASGAAGGGSVRIGGDFHGQGTLPAAQTTSIDIGSTLRADAGSSGNGGSVVVWSEGSTFDAGQVSAHGGVQAGNGGQVEISSHDVLNFAGHVDLVAPHGQTGGLLLDPYNVTIQTAAGAPADTCSAGTCTPSGSNSILTVSALQTALASSNVTVTTGAAGGDVGNIAVSNPVTWSSAYGLTLTAAKNIQVNASVTATGSGSLALNSTAGSISVSSATLSTQAGNLNLSAPASGGATAINLTGATLAVGAGTGTMSGTSSTANGVGFSGSSSLTAGAGGSLSATGTTSSSGIAVAVLAHAHLTTAGNVTLSGTSSGSIGFRCSSGTLTDSSGNLVVNGNSPSSNGVLFSGNSSVTNSGGGTIAFTGISSSYRAVELLSGGNLTVAGNTSFTGTSGTGGTGVFLNTFTTFAVTRGNVSVTANNTANGVGLRFASSTSSNSGPGTVSFSGTSATSQGVLFTNGDSLSNSGGGALTVSGTSASGSGLQFNGGATLTTAGPMALTGASTNATGMNFLGGTLTTSSGNLTLGGTSSSNYGVSLSGTNSLSASGSASVTVSGSSSSGGAALIIANGASVTSSGPVTLSDTTGSLAATAVDVAGSLTDSSGVLSLRSVTGNRVVVDPTGSVTSSGNVSMSGGSLTINGAVSVGANTLTLDSGGAVTQSAAITAGSLALTGGGNFTLTNSGNNETTLAGVVNTAQIVDSTGLTIGTVNATHGLTATGTLNLQTTGASSDLTIASGATVSASGSGNALVLAAGRNFINNDGVGALSVAGGGRWLIYSTTPSGDVFGNLDSTNAAIWEATYSGNPPANIAASGNRYLFSYQPTLTFTSTNASKVYGSDATSATSASYTASGYQNAVAGAFLGDGAGTTFTGAPAVTSVGSAPTATVAGSPYAITVAQGSVTSIDNYALSFQSTGQLTVNPATLTVTASNQSKTYGTTLALGSSAFTQTGLVNSDSISGVTLASAGSPATATVAGSPYAITASNAVGSGLSNYSISYVNGSLAVNPASLTVTASNQSKTYGTTLALGNSAFTEVGLVNSDTLSAVTLSSPGSPATATVAGGPYAITASNAVGTGLSNYSISYVNGSLAVNPAALTVTASNQSKTYGTTLALGSSVFTETGLVNSDTVSAVTLSSPGSIAGAAVGGPYAIMASNALGSGLSNYHISYVSGALMVDPASQSKTYDATLNMAISGAKCEEMATPPGSSQTFAGMSADVMALRARARCAHATPRTGDSIDWRAITAARSSMAMPSLP
ncbi:MAG: filamentous hemagglutinin N-terminal domain-containing protein [Pseudomonadota bacterium]|nr:filamentous hemagglutinin N-terminal domain-containing protein [Pseudomonadota bacterium]